ncbi:Hypothetical predicted protein [Scomber scombrus]|uniref:Uncharacterized protein n=1 Tax=Scomber scombrus TaxID=13677 RepID=A0AAV1PZR2_SCOSC
MICFYRQTHYQCCNVIIKHNLQVQLSVNCNIDVVDAYVNYIVKTQDQGCNVFLSSNTNIKNAMSFYRQTQHQGCDVVLSSNATSRLRRGSMVKRNIKVATWFYGQTQHQGCDVVL